MPRSQARLSIENLRRTYLPGPNLAAILSGPAVIVFGSSTLPDTHQDGQAEFYLLLVSFYRG